MESLGLNEVDMHRIPRRLAGEGDAFVTPDHDSVGVRALCVARSVLDMARRGKTAVARIESVRGWLAARSLEVNSAASSSAIFAPSATRTPPSPSWRASSPPTVG